MEPKHFISTKKYIGFPCTHRAWKAESHCRFVHGYSREFYFEFECHTLSKEGWVVDFGGLNKVKDWLNYMFDHTFLVAEDDPYLDKFKELDRDGIIQLRTLPNIGMEGTSNFVYDKINEIIEDISGKRAWVKRVEVRENEKNSSYYEPRKS